MLGPSINLGITNIVTSNNLHRCLQVSLINEANLPCPFLRLMASIERNIWNARCRIFTFIYKHIPTTAVGVENWISSNKSLSETTPMTKSPSYLTGREIHSRRPVSSTYSAIQLLRSLALVVWFYELPVPSLGCCVITFSYLNHSYCCSFPDPSEW